jgi:hypothetical protein
VAQAYLTEYRQVPEPKRLRQIIVQLKLLGAGLVTEDNESQMQAALSRVFAEQNRLVATPALIKVRMACLLLFVF